MKKTIWMSVGICVIFCTVLMFFMSCKKNHYFSQEYVFPDRIWEAGKFVTLSFDIPASCIGKNFDMYIEFDHTPDIERNSILMDVTAVSPIDERSVEYNIFLKGVDGKFKGKAEGNLLHFKQLLRNHFVFSTAGTWTFEFKQRSELFYFGGLKNMRLVFQESAKEQKRKNP